MIAKNRLTSGTTSGSIDIDAETTKTDTTNYGGDGQAGNTGVINLGDSGTGAGEKVETGGANDGTVGAIDTSDEIQDAGGPDAVITDTSEQANKASKAIGKVTKQLKDAASGGGGGDNSDLPPKSVTGARNAANSGPSPSVMPPDWEPPGKGGKAGKGGAKAVLAVLVGLALFLFGGA